MLLTIGQLADHCGVTVRTIRHYHQVGLLAEPRRDASGYRRYDARALVDLVRIRALTGAGVPLAHVRELIAAEEADFSTAVGGIDRALRRRIRDLQHRRRQLAGLVAGDRLVLPAEVADLLEVLRTLGISERALQMERDGWIVLAALCPEVVPKVAGQKAAALAEPQFQRLYLACDQAREWDADDPRLEELARALTDWAAKQPGPGVRTGTRPRDRGLPVVEQLMAAQFGDASPAWRRLAELSTGDAQRVRNRG